LSAPAAPKRRRWPFFLCRTGMAILGIAFLGAVVLTGIGLQDDLAPADLALVLGAKVELDGQPSRGLRARLALPRPRLSVDSGQWWSRQRRLRRSCRDGRHANRRRGAARTDHPDNEGVTTYASAQNTRRLLRERNWQRVMVISQYYHLPRARLTLRRFGIAPVSFAHAHCFEWRDLYSLPREEAGLLSYSLRSYPQD
jgi:uncharacterized SAM-binding protein YcdF (DUF218 family)